MKKIVKLLSLRWLTILHDLFMINFCWVAAFLLRFDDINLKLFNKAYQMLLIVVIVQTISCFYMGLYRGIWRYASLADLTRIIKSVGFGTVISLLILFLVHRLDDLPRSIIIIYSLLLFLSLSGSRFIVRKIQDYRVYVGKRMLIIGANRYGESLVRELLRESKNKYINNVSEIPIAFVDDDPNKYGQEIHGLRVVGRYQDLLGVIIKYKIDVIAITMPLLSAEQKKQIINMAEKTKLPVKILPSTNEILSGKITKNALRKISIEDLLGREEANINWQLIRKEIVNKQILITGAGGSIGSELCRQLITLSPKTLILIDNCEYNLFNIEEELKNLLKNKILESIEIKRYLIDIYDEVAISHVMQTCKPQIIFHTAAFKHVPILENQIRQAVKNNIVGTMIMARNAIKFSVDNFVLVSTDKAVNPINVMGTTKRITEMVCQYYNQISKTKFIAVRFGNVLGSVGSVVPIFNKQLEEGGPITVTHPEMSRFFMTISEACQLILQALFLGKGGETFVLDMGEPIKIKDLAEKMIRLSGKIPNDDIKIEYTGLRAGEKLHEKLFYSDEKLQQTSHQQIQLALPYQLNNETLSGILNNIEIACVNYNEDQLSILLKEILNSEIKYIEYVNA